MLRRGSARALTLRAAAAAWILLSSAAAHALVVLGNYDGTFSATSATDFYPGFSKSVGFTVPAGPYYRLNGYRVGFRLNSVGSQTATLELWSDAPGNPATMLASIGSLTVTNLAPAQPYLFSPASPVYLAPGTTYWLMLTGTGGSQLLWVANSASSYPVDSIFAFETYLRWIPGTGWIGSAVYNAFEIDADPYLIPTATTLGGGPNPALPGAWITLRAVVAKTEALDGAPTGAVTFSIDGVDQLPPVPIDPGGAAELLVPADQLGVGDHLVVARYGGDTLFAASESEPLTLAVATLQEIPTLDRAGLAALAALMVALALAQIARRRQRAG